MHSHSRSPIDQRRPLLSVEGLELQFVQGGVPRPALKGVSWSVEAGETLAIIGESGSGKSVSVSAVMGLLDSPPARISAGKVIFDGVDLLQLDGTARRRLNGSSMSMVFQDPLASLNPVLSVGRQIEESLVLGGTKPAKARTATIELMTRVGIHNAGARHADFPHQFSGGQRQRIMIAMAIARHPKLLMADEPTSALDVTVQKQILNLIKDLQRETGMALVFITHDINIAASIADKIVVMKAGEVVEAGPVDQIVNAPRHDYTRMLIQSIPGKGALKPPKPPRDKVLVGDDLSKSYWDGNRLFRRNSRKVQALKGVSISVEAEETVCIVGESGSGKSTLVKLLLGLESADSGAIAFLGEPLLQRGQVDPRRFRGGVQAVFQDPSSSLNPFMTVGEIVGEAWKSRFTATPDDPAGEIARLLEHVGLEPASAQRYPNEFSGGQRQRIAIARALASRPKVLVCDEAVSALDVSVQARIIELLGRLQKEYHLAIVFVTHDLSVVHDFADRVFVMSAGEVVEHGQVEQIFHRPQHAYTVKLLQSHLGPSA